MSYRALLIRVVTFIGGLYFFLKFVLPKEFALGGVVINLTQYNESVSAALTAIFSMALGLGLVNLLMVHGGAILYQRKGAVYSGALLAGLTVMLVLSAYGWRQSLRISSQAGEFFMLSEFALRIETDARANVVTAFAPEERHAKLQHAARVSIAALEQKLDHSRVVLPRHEDVELRQSIAKVQEILPTLEVAPEPPPTFEPNRGVATALSDLGTRARAYLTAVHAQSVMQRVYDLFFQGVFVALGSAMFSLLGFYIASAAYRAFRIRSVESMLMMGAALLVILGQIPFAIFGHGAFGEQLQAALPKIRLWLLTVPNSAAFRAIELGAAVAGLIMAFRMWLSIESGSFAGRDKK